MKANPDKYHLLITETPKKEIKVALATLTRTINARITGNKDE